LKAELVLEDAVEKLRVGACVAVVDHVIAAHDACNTRLDGVTKRPDIQLVKRPVVDVG
jgi:hypothetical protein